MKINEKYYDTINGEPLSVQETKLGNIQIYCLNDYPHIYDTYISRGQFTCWSNKGGKDYKLLIESSFNVGMKDLYTKRVNECWLEFYDYIEVIKTKALKFQFIPLSMGIFIVLILISMFTPEAYEMASFIVSIVLLVAFLILTNYLKVKNNKSVQMKKNETVNKIELILGKDRFNEILDLQEQFAKDFYKKDEENNEEVIENEEQ